MVSDEIPISESRAMYHAQLSFPLDLTESEEAKAGEQ